MHPSMLPEIKYIITHSDTAKLSALALQFMETIHQQSVEDFIERVNAVD